MKNFKSTIFVLIVLITGLLLAIVAPNKISAQELQCNGSSTYQYNICKVDDFGNDYCGPKSQTEPCTDLRPFLNGCGVIVMETLTCGGNPCSEWIADGYGKGNCNDTWIYPTNTPIPSNTPIPPTNPPTPTSPPGCTFNCGNGTCCKTKGESCSNCAADCGTCPTIPITVTDTPVPTSPPSCIGEGGNCLNNQQGCCGALECNTTEFTGGYGTCMYLSGQGGCDKDVCRDNVCRTVYYNPGANGCDQPSKCTYDSDCNQPPPPSSSCIIYGPSAITIGSDGKAYGGFTMTKDQSGGAIHCTQPTVAPQNTGAKCSEYNYGLFTDCFDGDSCSGTIVARDDGNCTISFSCENGVYQCSKTFDVLRPTNTPTPTPTPQGPWVKLKNACYQTTFKIKNPVPTWRLPFEIKGSPDDEDSPANKYLIRGEGGVIASKKSVSFIANTESSSKDWQISNYDFALLNSKTTYLAYAKARKQITTLSTLSGDLSDINGPGIYYYAGDVTITASDPPHNFVLIVDGTVTIDPAGSNNFNYDGSGGGDKPTKSVAIFADNINFDDSVDRAYGIFIADNQIYTGVANKGLKVIGNVVSNNLNNERKQPN